MMGGQALTPADPAETRLRSTLRHWADSGWLRPLDWAFGQFLWQEAPDASPWLILAATLASHQLGRGHVCLDLGVTLTDPAAALSLPPEQGAASGQGAKPCPPKVVLAELTLSAWLAALKHPELVATGPGNTPLVLAGTRLYLRRYWQYEQDIRAGIERRLRQTPEWQAALPATRLLQTLEALFPAASPDDGQKIACALAARSAFSIITGGPGTGKTTTVVRLLALLQSLRLSDAADRPLRIRLAAPTGKAAARLNQSLAASVHTLNLSSLDPAEAIRAAIPLTVTTLHRLLGSRPDTRRFRNHARNPLALDVLVIDEASMIDLEMMAAVLAALPAQARLILLGDKDQLASVEAGAVLGELCQRAELGHYLPETNRWLKQAAAAELPGSLIDPNGAPLDQSVIMLRRSHRFAAASGIGQLARAVNAGDVQAVMALASCELADLAWLSVLPDEDAGFRALVIDGGPPAGADAAKPARQGYRHFLEYLRERRPERTADAAAVDAWARGVLHAHAQFQILCALRRGPWGIEGLNQRIADLLCQARLISRASGWYEGRPVLVTRNDYGLGLMNGDIGITLNHPGPAVGTDGLRVAFPSGDGALGIRWVLPSRLQAVETVYALTVHKSQGSEFAHAALVLPDRISPILTQEWLYTGITRASQCFTLANAGGPAVLRATVTRRVMRHSGLVNPGGAPGL